MIKTSKRQLLRDRNEAVIKYNDLKKAADEVNMVVDAILAEVVRAFGADGEIIIDAPKASRKKLVEAEKTDEGKLIIRLRRNDNDTERSNQESGRAATEHD